MTDKNKDYIDIAELEKTMPKALPSYRRNPNSKYSKIRSLFLDRVGLQEFNILHIKKVMDNCGVDIKNGTLRSLITQLRGDGHIISVKGRCKESNYARYKNKDNKDPNK